MDPSLVSVVIPAFNQADFLAAAVDSVLNQSYPHCEVIVVNDASTDHTDEVMQRYADSARVRYIVHRENKRLSAARNTGIEAAKGTTIALLDADDYFHPRKIEQHVRFLRERPEIGLSYNSRFELNHSADSIREVWSPPMSVGLREVLLGFPFSPSDTVVRREWFGRVGLFDPEVRSAEDTDFPCRLALAGCKFGGIDAALNFRRHHSGRHRRNLAERLREIRGVVDRILDDPKLPEDVRGLGSRAFKHHLMVISSAALIQGRTDLARQCVRELLRIDPVVGQGDAPELLEFLIGDCIADDSVDHEALLAGAVSILPEELAPLRERLDWAVAKGYVWKGVRALVWNREQDGRAYLDEAARRKAEVDPCLRARTAYELLQLDKEFGDRAAADVLVKLTPLLNALTPRSGDETAGAYWVSGAFERHRGGRRP